MPFICAVAFQPGYHLYKYARIYALAEHLGKFLNFMQAPMLQLAHKYAHIYASGILALLCCHMKRRILRYSNRLMTRHSNSRLSIVLVLKGEKIAIYSERPNTRHTNTKNIQFFWSFLVLTFVEWTPWPVARLNSPDFQCYSF